MSRHTFAVSLGTLLALGGIGCVSCPPTDCHKIVYEAGPTCEVPGRCRDRVYAFLVSGVNPVGGDGFDALQECLYHHGFRKVGRASVLHGGWLVGEMTRIRACDPDARFVLVGHDVGAMTAMRAALKGREQGLPVEAAILLDPAGTSTLKGCASVRTVVIRSGGGTIVVPNAEVVAVPEATHFDLASKPAAMATVCGVLEEIGMSLWSAMPNHEKYPSWENDSGPTGPQSPPVVEQQTSEWNFLNERVGGVTTPLPAAVVYSTSELTPVRKP